MTEHKIDDGREFIRLDGGWLRNMIDRFAAGTMSADAVLSELTASISADFWNSPRTWSLPAPPPDDVTVVHIPEMYELQGGPELYRADDEDGLWWGPDGALWDWSQMLGNGTVVEGEPPAPEPVFAVGDRVRVKSTGRTGIVREEVDSLGRYLIFGDNGFWIVGVRADNLEPAPEPPRFERGFYRLARDLDTEQGMVTERLVFIALQDAEDGTWRVFLTTGDAWTSSAALAAAGAERVEE